MAKPDHYVETLGQQGHLFRPVIHTSPSFCDLCGKMCWGLQKHGKQCIRCKANVHELCVAQATRLAHSTFPCSDQRPSNRINDAGGGNADKNTKKLGKFTLRGNKSSSSGVSSGGKIKMPGTAQGVLTEARKMGDAGQLRRVVKMLEVAVAKFPDEHQLRKMLVGAAVDIDNQEIALGHCSELLFRCPNDPDTFIFKAELAIRAASEQSPQPHQAGRRELEQALLMDPNHEYAKRLLANMDSSNSNNSAGNSAGSESNSAGSAPHSAGVVPPTVPSVQYSAAPPSAQYLATPSINVGAAGVAGASHYTGMVEAQQLVQKLSRNRSPQPGLPPSIQESSYLGVAAVAAKVQAAAGGGNAHLPAPVSAPRMSESLFGDLTSLFAGSGGQPVPWIHVEGLFLRHGRVAPHTACVLFGLRIADTTSTVSQATWTVLSNWLDGAIEADRVLHKALDFSRQPEFFGFLSSDEARDFLVEREVGSWLVRMSGAQAQSLAISAKSDQSSIDHKRIQLVDRGSHGIGLAVPDAPGAPSFDGDDALAYLAHHARTSTIFVGKEFLLKSPAVRALGTAAASSGHMLYESMPSSEQVLLQAMYGSTPAGIGQVESFYSSTPANIGAPAAALESLYGKTPTVPTPAPKEVLYSKTPQRRGTESAGASTREDGGNPYPMPPKIRQNPVPTATSEGSSVYGQTPVFMLRQPSTSGGAAGAGQYVPKAAPPITSRVPVYGAKFPTGAAIPARRAAAPARPAVGPPGVPTATAPTVGGDSVYGRTPVRH